MINLRARRSSLQPVRAQFAAGDFRKKKRKMKNEKQKLFATKVEKILEKIFDKEPVKKPKKEKKKPVEEEEEQLPEVEEEEEDDVPEDEGGLDVEPEVDEEVVEEEEYFSEPET